MRLMSTATVAISAAVSAFSPMVWTCSPNTSTLEPMVVVFRR